MKHNLKTLMDAYKRGLFTEEYEKLEKELRALKEAWESLPDNQPDLNIIKEILGE